MYDTMPSFHIGRNSSRTGQSLVAGTDDNGDPLVIGAAQIWPPTSHTHANSACAPGHRRASTKIGLLLSCVDNTMDHVEPSTIEPQYGLAPTTILRINLALAIAVGIGR
ncbi:MAG: hypothetical protein ACRDT5_16780 [Mycobacterium sp.]